MFFHQLLDYSIDGGNHQVFHFLRPPGFLAVDDSGYDIFPVTDLSIIFGMLSHNIAVIEVQQLSPNRGGSNIDGHGIILSGSYPRVQY